LGEPSTFFGGRSTVAVLGFSAASPTGKSTVPKELVKSGGTLRACRTWTFFAFLKGEGGKPGTPWSRRWRIDGKVFEGRSTWPADETFTRSWGPFYVDSSQQPTHEALPSGRWTLTVLIDGRTVSTSAVTLVNDAC
jgi:hypothetical protein